MKLWQVGTLVVFLLGATAGLLVGQLGIPADAKEPPKRSPVEPVPDRDVYYPGSEPIAPNEMRVVACGTGMPSVRPKQAAACFLVEPGYAVAYHFYNDFDIAPEMLRRIRKTYDGDVSLATDYMVWNVTKDGVRVRMSAPDEEIWPSPALKKKNPPDFTNAVPISDFTKSGALAFPEVVGPLYDEINELYGTDYKPGFK